MYDPRNLFRQQPVAIAGAIRAVLYALVLMSIIVLTPEQLAGIAIALEMVLGLFVWKASTSATSPNLKAGTSVNVQGSEDRVVIQPSPPGPTGIEGDGAG